MKSIAVLVTALLIADVAGAAVAGSDGTEMLIPIAGRTEGARGEMWNTELTLVNLTGDDHEVELTWLPQGGTSNPETVDVPMPPHTFRTIGDVAELFGTTGIGAVYIRALDPAAAIDAHARIWTDSPCVDWPGSLSQSVPAVLFSGWRNDSPAYVHGVRSGNAFRANYGIVNISNQPREFRVYVNSFRGRVEEIVTVPAGGIVQRPLPQPVSGPTSVYFEPLDDGGRWHGYASTIDNFSGSGWTIPAMQPRTDVVFD